MKVGNVYVMLAGEADRAATLRLIAEHLPEQRIFVGVIDPIDPASSRPRRSATGSWRRPRSCPSSGSAPRTTAGSRPSPTTRRPPGTSPSPRSRRGSKAPGSPPNSSVSDSDAARIPATEHTEPVTAPRALRLGGTDYPVLLPSLRDPRLHLAGVIVSLQVLGQVAFEFRLSIAQILISILTCAVLEVAITFRRQRVVMWPASAMLTGNGVAFILRVPGTEHGDWWSLHGWWIFAGTAAISLLSKYLIRFRGRHVFNPSNFGLVACFLLLGPARAEPLDFWWGPMSGWLALALALIVAGGFAILRRLHLLSVALSFWLVFAAGIAVLATTEHAMTARWHLGPITGAELWRVLVFSPEILVFLFFMITDPKTVPASPPTRRTFGAAIGLLAVLLIAPWTSEFATKVAVLAALALVCAARPVIELVLSADWTRATVDRTRLRIGAAGRAAVGASTAAAVVAATGLVFVAGIAADPSVGQAGVDAPANGELPEVQILPSHGVATQLDMATADQIVLATLAWVGVPAGEVDHAGVTLEPGEGQGPPIAVATLVGSQPLRFERSFELSVRDGAFAVRRERDPSTSPPATTEPPARSNPVGFVAPQLHDVAGEVGLRFRHGAFRFSVGAGDAEAMMGGGLCWLDYDADGWLDLFVVNSYAERDVARWRDAGDLPRSALFHNDGGTFTDVSRGSGANLARRGNGCVAADVDLDGRTDLYVTSTTYDALLWNRGDGTFSEIARPAGIASYGWHAGAAVGDFNGDGLPDIIVTGYTDPNAPIPGSVVGYPTNHRGVRDLLYLNLGTDRSGRPKFREVGLLAGLDPGEPEHGLGAVVTDLDGDGRLDVYVANDEDPNRLYRNEPWPGGVAADPAGLGFRLREVAGRTGVADANAGMGIAAADYDRNGGTDLFVSNSRGQGHAVYRQTPTGYADGRDDFADTEALTGWGDSWIDLDLDTDLDLVLTNGDIPVRSLAGDAEPIQVLENQSNGTAQQFADLGLRSGDQDRLQTNGRGLAAADYDNDGDLDVAINSIGGPLILLDNTTSGGNWLAIRLPGFWPGARVTAVLPDGRELVRQVQAGGSYLSSEDPRLLFGLGDAPRVLTVVIQYPDGTQAHLQDITANQLVDAPRPAA
jgi:Na+-translocating ferredoxin:NAD+ oxidoreductase RnfD subunit